MGRTASRNRAPRRTQKKKAPKPAVEVPKAKPSKLSYQDQRDYDLLPKRIEAIEAEIARDEAALADPNLYTRDFARFQKLTETVAKLRDEKDAAEMRWLELAEQVEALG